MKNKEKSNFNLFTRKTLQQAIDEANKPLSKMQKRLQAKYGKRYAVNGSGLGCVFK